jgi:hypothetical protein
MDSVYQRGILNIAATGFADGSNGLFVTRDQNLLTPICVAVTGSSLRQPSGSDQSVTGPSDTVYHLCMIKDWDLCIFSAPLSTRAWALQERALSVRTVHFGTQQIFWECVCQDSTEVFPSWAAEHEYGYESPKSVLKPIAETTREKVQMSSEMSRWIGIVSTYSGCSLTYSKDKLVAISGIAKFMRTSMGCRYLAGLWDRDLEHQLLWEVVRNRPKAKDTTRAPSWSWASIDAYVRLGDWDIIGDEA